tara:strand:- start:10531 stop:10956 length:426 start_codon:yes stop_codon:yes gene_type:complete
MNDSNNLTEKQERFCLKKHETGNASAAYRFAYDAEKMKEATINVKACELLKNGKVTARLKQLQDAVVAKHNVTVESLMTELEEARGIALTYDENGKAQPSAAVSASMGKAKLAGLLVDKLELNINGLGERFKRAKEAEQVE